MKNKSKHQFFKISFQPQHKPEIVTIKMFAITTTPQNGFSHFFLILNRRLRKNEVLFIQGGTGRWFYEAFGALEMLQIDLA